jgi:hypothetical protein
MDAVLVAWPSLPEPIRLAILALVATATNEKNSAQHGVACESTKQHALVNP